MATRKQADAVIRTLMKAYPGKAAMEFERPQDVLLATVLSARTRDEQVLEVYPRLRKAFPKLRDLAEADISEIEKAINRIGMYRNKARFMKGIAQALVERHGGKVPRTREALEALPGVGRKTANCVLCYAFGEPAIAVDTHVFRITHRLGWTDEKSLRSTEDRIMELVSPKLWLHVNRVFVQFGRTICIPGKPRCYRCPVSAACAYRPKTKKP